MARIKIEDLPAAEDLTPEEEALLEGAGLRSFRPTLEGLEDRQLLASHVAAALPAPPPALGGSASVGQALCAPRIEIHTGLTASAPAQAELLRLISASQGEDTRAVLEAKMRAFITNKMLPDGLYPRGDRPGEQEPLKVVDYTPSQDGNKVEMTMRAYQQVGTWGRYNEVKVLGEVRIRMELQGRMEGGDKVFSLARVRLDGNNPKWFDADQFVGNFTQRFRFEFGTGAGIHVRQGSLIHTLGHDSVVVGDKVAELFDKKFIKDATTELVGKEAQVSGDGIVVTIDLKQGVVFKDVIRFELHFARGPVEGDSQVYRLSWSEIKNLTSSYPYDYANWSTEVHNLIGTGVRVGGQFDGNALSDKVGKALEGAANKHSPNTDHPHIVTVKGYEALANVTRVKLTFDGREVLVDLRGSYVEGKFQFEVTGVDDGKGAWNQKNAQAAPAWYKELLQTPFSMDQV